VSAFDHNSLDDVIHGRVRLGIMAYLSGSDEADFVSLRQVLKLSDGNLSTHLAKLEEAGYVRVKKRFVDKKPQTTASITDTGRKAYIAYLDQLKQLLKGR
jgi:DNA-binding MarR family transcriptional regulator